MENYDISVAIATYQGDRYLFEQLDSILRQTIRPIEIIVCDDGSTDKTIEILNSFNSPIPLRVYSNESTLGVVKNFAKAISLCRSRYIALADQDDIWFENKLEKSIKKMREIEIEVDKPSLVFSDLTVVDSELSIINDSFWRHLNSKPEEDGFGEILFGNTVTGCTMVFNKEMAGHLIKIPQEATMHDHWAALIAYGFGQVGLVSESLMLYRQHGGNITNNYKRSVKLRVKYFIEEFISQRYTFLSKEINQAIKFRELYRSKLTSDNSLRLEKFIRLENKGFFRKKWASFKSNNKWVNFN